MFILKKHLVRHIWYRSLKPFKKRRQYLFLGNSQTVHLGNGCVHQMIVEHEILHAMGIYHEQARPDRDERIIVHYENIQTAYHRNAVELYNYIVRKL